MHAYFVCVHGFYEILKKFGESKIAKGANKR